MNKNRNQGDLQIYTDEELKNMNDLSILVIDPDERHRHNLETYVRLARRQNIDFHNIRMLDNYDPEAVSQLSPHLVLLSTSDPRFESAQDDFSKRNHKPEIIAIAKDPEDGARATTAGADSFIEGIDNHFTLFDKIYQAARELYGKNGAHSIQEKLPFDREDVYRKIRHIASQIRIGNSIGGVFQELDISDLERALSPALDLSQDRNLITKGHPEYPGAASALVTHNLKEVQKIALQGEKAIAYVDDLSALSLTEIKYLRNAAAIIYKHVSTNNHHVIDLKNAGIPMVHVPQGFEFLQPLLRKGRIRVKDREYGNEISIDGFDGSVYEGFMDVMPSEIVMGLTHSPDEKIFRKGLVDDYNIIMEKLQGQLRAQGKEVAVNADTLEQIVQANARGVSSVGLTRTENLLKIGNNTEKYGQYILSLLTGSEPIIAAMRQEFIDAQRGQFYDLLKHQQGNRIHIRLLDPPLTEFFDKEMVKNLQFPDYINIKNGLSQRVDEAKKTFMGNDYLNAAEPGKNLRGAALAMRHPEIYEAQITAIFDACKDLQREEGFEKGDFKFRIYVPYVTQPEQVEIVRSHVRSQYDHTFKGNYDSNVAGVGITVETPMGMRIAPSIVGRGVYDFTFGTNDLFPSLLACDREQIGEMIMDKDGQSYRIPTDIMEWMNETVRDIRSAADIKKKQAYIGISGEMNPVLMNALKEVIHNLDYVSAGRPSDIPFVTYSFAKIMHDYS